MACNTERANCTPEEIMAAGQLPCGKFVNGENLQAEQLVYDLAYRDLINNMGIEINYYVNTFTLTGGNLLYGEEPTAAYLDAIPMQMYVELSQDALTLSQFGFDPGDDFTGFLHIETFTDTMSALSGVVDYFSLLDTFSAIEPRAGDLIELTALGCDRPGGRGPKIYEITERVDEDISAINPMLGHYVYRVRAKRYDYSYKPNSPKEKQNEQVYDNSFTGVLSTNIPGDEVSPTKQYEYNIDQISQDDVYDMDNNNTDIYGGYY